MLRWQGNPKGGGGLKVIREPTDLCVNLSPRNIGINVIYDSARLQHHLVGLGCWWKDAAAPCGCDQGVNPCAGMAVGSLGAWAELASSLSPFRARNTP